MPDNPPERVVIDTTDDSDQSWWSGFKSRFTKSVETTSKQPGFGFARGNVERIRPADSLPEWRAIPKTTPIVRKALSDFTSDVVEPGYRITTDDDAVQEYLEEEWCPQAAIVGGETHNDLLPFIRLFDYERWRGGDAMAENVRADPTDADSPITGVHLLNPEHVEFITYEDKNILVAPDDEPTDGFNPPQTARGESAAYVQYGDEAIVPTDRDAVPLSQNDVTRSSLDPPPGKVRGTPVTKTIATDVAGYKNIKRDKEEAIKTKAYGLWAMEFGRDTIEYQERDENGQLKEVTEIIEWSEEDQDDTASDIENDLGPGSIMTYDGVANLKRIDGEVPDLIDDLQHYVSEILTTLPTPLFLVGFEENINQFVTEKQDERYQELINEERRELERVFTALMERVVEHNLVNGAHDGENVPSVSEVPEDLEFKLKPEESESPVLSHDTETIEKMHTWAQAYSELRGDVPTEKLLELDEAVSVILDLPEDAVADLEGLEDELADDGPDAPPNGPPEQPPPGVPPEDDEESDENLPPGIPADDD